MKANDAFPSKFLAAADLQEQDRTLKITHVDTDEIGGKQKFICHFAGAKKGLVLNKTNFNTIVKVTGEDDTDNWTGHSVCLYPTMVDFQGDQVAAIRIKAPANKPQRQAIPDRDNAPIPPPRRMIGGVSDNLPDGDSEIPF